MARFCSPRHAIVPSFSKRQSSKFTDIINKTGNEPLSWEITQWIFDFPLVSWDGFLISAVAFVSQVARQFEVKLSICIQIQKEYHEWREVSVRHCLHFPSLRWVFSCGVGFQGRTWIKLEMEHLTIKSLLCYNTRIVVIILVYYRVVNWKIIDHVVYNFS